MSTRDLTIALESLKNLIGLVPKENFHKYLYQLRSQVFASEQKAFHLAQYASLLELSGFYEEAGKAVEESLKEVDKELSEHPNFLANLFPKLTESGLDFPQDWLDKIFLLFKKATSASPKITFMGLVAISLTRRGNFTKAFKLLEQEGFSDPVSRTYTLKKIIREMKGDKQPGIVLYWNMMFEQIVSLGVKEHCLELLSEAQAALLSLKTSEDDPIWNRYLMAVDRLQDLIGEEEKDKLLNCLAMKLAEKGFWEKAREVARKIFESEFRSQPLAEVANYLIEKKGDLGSAFRLLEDLSPKGQLKVLSVMAGKIPTGESGKAWWKNITGTLSHLTWEGEEFEGADDAFVAIATRLMEAFACEESFVLWEEFFTALHTLPHENLLLKILEGILSGLKAKETWEKSLPLWPLIDQATSHLVSSYAKAMVQAKRAIVYTEFGQIGEAQQLLEEALQILERETKSALVLEAMAQITLGYRELGQEKRCRELFEKILSYSGIAEGKKIKHWNPGEYILYLANLGLENFALTLAEKLVLAAVEAKDEVPPLEAFIKMAELCTLAGLYQSARQILFRVLPEISKDPIGSGTTPLYLQVTQLLEKISDSKTFQDAWERTAELVLNFPKASLQEQCLESLASVLSQRGSFSQYRPLWDKLLTAATYIGDQLESLRSSIRVARQMALSQPWEALSAKFQRFLVLTAQIASEYDEVQIIEMLGEVLLSSPQFDKMTASWNDLITFAKARKRQDCQSLALLSLSKLLAKRGRDSEESLREAEKLVEQIAKPQSKCEGYLALARAYPVTSSKQISGLINKALEIGKNLGTFYSSKLLPGAVECWLSLSEYQLALEALNKIEEPLLKASLGLQMVAHYRKQKQEKQALTLLDEMLPVIKATQPQYGDQARMYILAGYEEFLLHGAISALPLFEKVFAGWEAIQNASYQKETVSFFATELKMLGNIPELTYIWQKLYQRALKIEQESYRFWALEELATAFIGVGKWQYVIEILDLLPPLSEARLHILAIYSKESDAEEALAFLSVLPSEEKQFFAQKLAEKLANQEDLAKLFQLVLNLPGNFPFLCDLTTKILSVALKSENKERFTQWFKEIIPFWGITGD
jgi:predicted GNAT family N-acyltransferase